MPGCNDARPLPSQDRLKELLRYDAASGMLLWKSRKRTEFSTVSGWKHANRQAGNAAGGVQQRTGKTPRRMIKIDGVAYMAARLTWKFHKGFDPHIIDHIDGDTLNNRIENIRDCLQYQNLANTQKHYNSASPYKGVTRTKSERWIAQIMIQGRAYHLGTYPTAKEAAAAYHGASVVGRGAFGYTDYDGTP